MKKTFVSWETFIEDCGLLSECVTCGNTKFTDIVAVARGGHIPAQIIAHKLDIARVFSIGLKLYDDSNKADQIKIYQPLDVSLFNNFSKILIIDEICDSGETFLYVKRLFQNLNIHTASIYLKMNSGYTPDYFVHEISERDWLVMPYEKE